MFSYHCTFNHRTSCHLSHSHSTTSCCLLGGHSKLHHNFVVCSLSLLGFNFTGHSLRGCVEINPHDIHQAPMWTFPSLLSLLIFCYHCSHSLMYTQTFRSRSSFLFTYIPLFYHLVPQPFSFMLRLTHSLSRISTMGSIEVVLSEQECQCSLPVGMGHQSQWRHRVKNTQDHDNEW